ncbi:MAG: hypothetical protein RR500_08955 [Bacilli bacterium]
MIKNVMLNNYRETIQLVEYKLNLTRNFAKIIVILYTMCNYIFSILLGLITTRNRISQLYFLLIGSIFIVAFPRFDKKTNKMLFVDKLIKSIVLIPSIMIAMVQNILICSMAFTLAFIINKKVYYKYVKNSYGLIGNLILVLIGLLYLTLFFWQAFIFYLIIGVFIVWQRPNSNAQNIFKGSVISFSILHAIYNNLKGIEIYGMVLIVIYLICVVKYSVCCQQEQFLNLKKSLLNIKVVAEEKFEIAVKLDMTMICYFLLCFFPLTFLIIYYKTNSVGLSIAVSIAISVLQYVLYNDLLMFGIVKFLDNRSFISNETDFLSYRYSPLFILGCLPIISIYYLYSLFSFKVSMVLLALLAIITISSVYHKSQMRQSIKKILE